MTNQSSELDDLKSENEMLRKLAGSFEGLHSKGELDCQKLKAENLKLTAACAEKDNAFKELVKYLQTINDDMSVGFSTNMHVNVLEDAERALSLDCGKSIMEEVTNLNEEIKLIADHNDALADQCDVMHKENKDLKAALKQCVEALETCYTGDYFATYDEDMVNVAITIAKQALGNPIADDKKEGDKLWCAMCGQWGDHQSGWCPELKKVGKKEGGV